MALRRARDFEPPRANLIRVLLPYEGALAGGRRPSMDNDKDSVKLSKLSSVGYDNLIYICFIIGKLHRDEVYMTR